MSSDKVYKAHDRGLQIRKLFDQCLDLSHEEQIELIAKSKTSNSVKRHVSKLLKFSSDEIELTQKVIDSVQVSLDVKPLSADMKIGAYELKEPIGEGGQAEVWLAERVDGKFNHKVAIKFLKPLHDKKGLARFQSERELLATLKHPNIAQLLDGGEFAEKRPYMVLEYVEGLPLLEYGLIKNFTLSEYLNCFLQICDAVSYAHTHSIIHRDIKPTNVYITHEGVVKLFDFGIAKFLDNKEMEIQTMPVMTLAYSSPEQVTGAPVSTATDVYGLGLLLYEMLTGKRAQAITNSVPADVVKQITDNSPVLPSELIKRIEFKRSYNSKQLKGDLDNLILMAIRKEPDRRYQNVEALANDVKNFLTEKPLLATGDSWVYKTKKYIGRNPIGTISTLALIIFMIALPIIQFQNQKQIKYERDKALQASQLAKEQTIIAKKTTNFLVNILESASPLASKGQDINLKDVLEGAERQLALGLDDQPKIKAHLLNKLAGIHTNLENYDKAHEYYRKSLMIFESINDLHGQVGSLGQLALVSTGHNKSEEVNSYAQKAERLSKQIKDPKQKAWHQVRMASIKGNMGEKKESFNRLTKALDIVKANKINDDQLLGRIYNDLSVVSVGNILALAYLEKAIYYAEQSEGKKSPTYYSRLLNKAGRLIAENRREEAEAVYIEALELAKQLYPEDHPSYASLIGDMAYLYHDFGRFKKAQEFYEEALRVLKITKGTKSLLYVIGINNLAYLMEDLGEFVTAERLFRESLELRKVYFSTDLMRVATNKGNLARLLSKMGKYGASGKLLDEIIPVFLSHERSIIGLEIVQMANTLKDKPDSIICQQNRPQLTRLIADVDGLEKNNWRRIYYEFWLGKLTAMCGNYQQAQKLFLAAQNSANRIYTENSLGQELINKQVSTQLSELSIHISK